MNWKKKWSYLAGLLLLGLIGGLSYLGFNVFTNTPDDQVTSTKTPVAQASTTPNASPTCQPDCKNESADEDAPTVVVDAYPYPTASVIPSATAESGPIAAIYPTPTNRPATRVPGATATPVPPHASPTLGIPSATPVSASPTNVSIPSETLPPPPTPNPPIPSETLPPTPTFDDGNGPIPSTTPTKVPPTTNTPRPQPPHWPPPPYPTWNPNATSTPTSTPYQTRTPYPTPSTPIPTSTWVPSPTDTVVPTATIVPTVIVVPPTPYPRH